MALVNNTTDGAPSIIEANWILDVFAILDISTKVWDFIRQELASDDRVDTKEEFYTKYDLEHTVFLRCGHVMGKACYDEYRNYMQGREGVNLCPICRIDNSCDGCHMNHEVIQFEEDVPLVEWPLNLARHDPWSTFRSRVLLTTAEITPGTRRYCYICIKIQLWSLWGELAFCFPYLAWRNATAANVDYWNRRQLARLADLVFPNTADIRFGASATLGRDPNLAIRRAEWVNQIMSERRFVDPMRRLVYRPCQQSIEQGEPAVTPLTRDELYNLKMLFFRVISDANSMYESGFFGWHRGIDDFRLPVIVQDPDQKRSEFIDYVRGDTFIQAVMNANPLVLNAWGFDLPRWQLRAIGENYNPIVQILGIQGESNFEDAADNLCTGCPDYVLYDHAFDPVAWPLDPASYNPHRKFMSEVGLTAPERGDDEVRFCHNCAAWHIRRKFAEMFLTFPAATSTAAGPRAGRPVAAAAAAGTHRPAPPPGLAPAMGRRVAAPQDGGD
ncbi:hypothetical protein PG995_005039 [Apiospora arundinis]